ncbi:hypothetical protein J5L86_001854 [Salmonella enterica]|nr:hypothetical protein [Salmonella enterica subsp. salamae]EHJ0754824.1 hypothetical protein [Salmonella enterica]
MLKTLETNFMIFGDVASEIINRVISIAKSKQRFMAEIMDDEKQDILDWWSRQPFDLGIPEHLGNCVFCIKKGINKVALAMRDEPQMLAQFREAIMSPDVRIVQRRQQENKIMYRKSHSLDSIEEAYSSLTRDEIAATIRGGGGQDSGSCTESCEAFIVGNNDSMQMDLFTNQEKAA